MKLIIYGFKINNNNAHKYIHEAFYIAGTYMGLETYWIDDTDSMDASFFNNSIIITEGWNNNKLPVAKNSKYIIHHFGNKPNSGRFQFNTRYICNNNKIIDLRFLCENFEDHNYKWNTNFKNLIKLDSCTYLDISDNYYIIYQPWATNLLPHEINLENAYLKRENKIYFIGTVDQSNNEFNNYNKLMEFKKECDKNKIPFIILNTSINKLQENDMRNYIKSSLFSPDIRNIHKHNSGYIACRLFKNISYGCLGLSDTIQSYQFFNKLIAYNENPKELFYEGMKYKNNIDMIKEAMILVKNNHTYINRLNTLINI